MATPVTVSIDACDAGSVHEYVGTKQPRYPEYQDIFNVYPNSFTTLYNRTSRLNENTQKKQNAIVKFDLTGLNIDLDREPVSSVTLRLFLNVIDTTHNPGPFEEKPFYIYQMDGTIAPGITVADHSNYSGPALATYTDDDLSAGDMIDIDVTSAIDLEQDYAGFLSTFNINTGSNYDFTFYAYFYGLDTPEFAPQLIINYDAVPEPASIILISLGLLGLIRKNKK